MVKEGNGRFFLVCNTCGGRSEAFDSSAKAQNSKVKLGWVCLQRKKDWWDICPSCQGSGR